MNNVKIELINHGVLDVSDDIPLALNFNLNDIADIKNRGGVWSKTIRLPGTANNNTILNNVFNVNITTLTFNQQVREAARIIVDGYVAFEGVFQVRKVKKIFKNSEDFKVEYDCYIKSDTSSFYTDISGKYLDELDLTEFNHTWEIANVRDSMVNGTWINGYQYFLGAVDDVWADYEARDLLPAIYARTYWDRIFLEAGYTYEWDEIGELKFDRQIIPYNGETLRPTVSEVYRFAAGISTGYEYWLLSTNSYQNSTPSVPGRTGFYTNNLPPVSVGRADVIFNDDATSPWFDYNELYSTTTGTYDVSAFDGAMEFETKYTVSMQFLMKTFTGAPNSDDILAQGGFAEVYVRNTLRVYDGNNVQLGILSEYNSDVVSLNEDDLPQAFSMNYKVEAGTFDVEHFAVYNSDDYPTAAYVKNVFEFKTNTEPQDDPWFGFKDGASRYQADIYAVFYPQPNEVGHFNNSPNTFVTEGSPITIKGVVPKKVKQSDFILAFTKMYNLYIHPDEYNPTNLIVRTRDKFYEDGNELDWTEKVNIESIDVELISNTQKKLKKFSYKEDSKDSLSEAYTEQTNEIYGQLEYIFENEFTKDVETVEPIFSPTFLLEQGDKGGTYRTVPYITARSPKNNIRILYVGDVLKGTWSYYNGEGNVPSSFINYTNYRFTGHIFPNPTTPNLDLHFGICDYYSHTGDITDNNLFNNHYANQMNIFDTGHIMTAYFNLNYTDVTSLGLNERIYIYDSWWYINKITDFDLNNTKLTKVELLSADPTIPNFVPNNNVVVNNSKGDALARARNRESMDKSVSNILGTNTIYTKILGNNNTVQSGSKSILIVGDRNRVDGVNNIIQGDNNTVNGDNITVLGYDGGTFDEDGTTSIGELRLISNYVTAGRDEVLNHFPDNKIINFVSAGRDEVRPIGTYSVETNIDGSRDKII